MIILFIVASGFKVVTALPPCRAKTEEIHVSLRIAYANKA